MTPALISPPPTWPAEEQSAGRLKDQKPSMDVPLQRLVDDGKYQPEKGRSSKVDFFSALQGGRPRLTM